MAAEAEPAPSLLGRYRILKHLASGGMAEVFLATATGIEGFERHVVIKRIHREHAKHPGFVQMFLDEARLAASLHHHNIVQVHDIGQDDGEYFYAMEYVHGEDLRGLLAKVKKAKQLTPLEHVVTVVSGAAAGLHYAHEHRGPDRRPLNIVHRDISPSNILVDYDGNVKVVDFGIAKVATKTERTRSGVLKGKVSYMSPEQCRGAHVDRRSDVYALGIVLYELTTVRRLFKGENDFMTMSAIVAGKIPAPSTRRPDLPPELEQIILKALAKDPADRFQTAHEMRQALDGFVASAGLRTSTTGLADYMETMFGGRRVEPWLVDTPLPPEDPELDFDGSNDGIAYVSMSAVENFVHQSAGSALRRSSPLIKARDKLMPDAADDPPTARPPTATSGGEAFPIAPTKPRSRGWVVAGIALALIAAGGVLVPRLLAEDTTHAGATSPAPASAPVPAAAQPAPAPAPLAAPVAAPPASSADVDRPGTPPASAPPAPSPSAPAAAGSPRPPVKSKPTTGKRKPPTTPKRPAAGSAQSDPNWNPDSLLPE